MGATDMARNRDAPRGFLASRFVHATVPKAGGPTEGGGEESWTWSNNEGMAANSGATIPIRLTPRGMEVVTV